MNSESTHIYFSDHSAMMTAEIELIERCRKANESDHDFSELVEFLRHLSMEVQQEQDVIRSLLKSQGKSPDILKELSGWVVEKIGRLKFNGQLTGYSELSRVLELEILMSSTQSRFALWKTVSQLEGGDEQDQAFAQRSKQHLRKLTEFHTRAVSSAFS